MVLVVVMPTTSLFVTDVTVRQFTASLTELS